MTVREQETDRLWAKRWTTDGEIADSVYLPGHLRDVYAATLQVLDATAQSQLNAFGLASDVWQPRFRRIVTAAATLHDLGKANNHFQGMIKQDHRRLGRMQGLRHEWVTSLILQNGRLRTWSRSMFSEAVDWHIAIWAITGHHPSYGRPSPPDEAPAGAGSELQLLLNHRDFQLCIDWISELFGLDGVALSADVTVPLLSHQAGNAFHSLRKAWRRDCAVWEGMSAEEQKLAAACKACLIGADVAGSALPKSGLGQEQRTNWVREHLSRRPSPEDIEALVRDRLAGGTERPFQRAVAQSPERVALVRAGCGSGKTIAAYLRAARRCPGKRLYFCYPTTGTATEGFRDYLFDPDHQHAKFGARLFHSRADVDIDVILRVQELTDPHADPNEEQVRIDSLAAWSTPIVCCTVDTVLGLLQNGRRGLFAWPAIAQSAFVFDEVHAYDDKLFGLLLRFLDALRGVPVLLMTASLPSARLDAIRAVLARNNERLAEIDGPADLEELDRYHRQIVEDPAQRVRDEIAHGGKVLWVANTVARAMSAADCLADCDPMIYHSRFRYEDRVRHHARVIESFGSNRPALAVCTQVAEMSLDLSATLLVSDLAPVPSLIQRLGRLNRRAVPPASGQPAPRTMPFVIVEPMDANGSFQPLPYSMDDFSNWPTHARAWLAALGDGAISQAELSHAWEALQTGASPTPVDSMWLDGGPVTCVDAVRDASPGVTVILDGPDLDAVRRGEKRVTQVALPMPRPPTGLDSHTWPRINGLLVAPADRIVYDPSRGGAWATEMVSPLDRLAASQKT